MSDHHKQTETQTEEEEERIPDSHSSEDQSPLLSQPQPQQQQQTGEDDRETELDKSLQRLDSFLTFVGFNQSSVSRFLISWTAFLIIGVALPVLILELADCSGCQKYQIKAFELDIIASQACLAAVSLICLSHYLRKYGLRRFLFVDRYSGQMERFSHDYIRKITESMRLLVLWVLPCFILKTGREVIRVLNIRHESWWQSLGILVALVVSWTYVTTIFFSACAMFYLVCNLQVIHFDDYGKKLLERESGVLLFIEEHTRLRHYLHKISHRFRIYLLLVFLVVTTSQIVTLIQTTGYRGIITFINGGDFAVSSIVQIVGITLCLNAAAKISHRAQGIVSIASNWHALVTCASDSSHLRSLNTAVAENPVGSFYISNSESDLESADNVRGATTIQLVSYMSSYHSRQAFVMYLQANPGGITIFGWTVDRALINTIFFMELSLVLFVLSKTVVFPSIL